MILVSLHFQLTDSFLNTDKIFWALYLYRVEFGAMFKTSFDVSRSPHSFRCYVMGSLSSFATLHPVQRQRKPQKQEHPRSGLS